MVESTNAVTTPEISVVMSLYNSERYLREAIDSVLSQTFSDFEFIIINDGSNDGSARIVQSYGDHRIHFVQQENQGLPAALNAAIHLAKSEVIARMDPDDICLPERLAMQYEYMQNNKNVMVLGAAARCINEDGDALPEIYMTPSFEAGDLAMPETPCIHPTVVFRKSAFMQAGGYSEVMRFGGEDAVLFNKILAFGKVENLSDVLLMYRLSPTSMSQKSRKFNILLRQMVCRLVQDDYGSDKDWGLLAKEYKRSGSGAFGYDMYVAKLFLRTSGKAYKARQYFRLALKEDPWSLYARMFFISSYIPLSWRKKLRLYLRFTK